MQKLHYLLKRMTQTELAKKMGINKTNITYWKRIGRIPFKQQGGLADVYKKFKQGK